MVILLIPIILMCFCIYMGFRNNHVYKEKIRIVGIVSILSSKDIDNDKEWMWRYDSFNKITYNEMLFKLWKPVKSFYDNHDCIKKT